MKCGIVLIIKDFDRLNEIYGLDYCLQSLVHTNPSEPIYLLIAEGFEKIPPEFLNRWDRAHVRIEDCSATVRSLFEDYPYLHKLPEENITYRVTFLRHLILERYFAGEPVLSCDVDFVWRVDPYKFFGGWQGGYFSLGTSGSLTYVNSPDWFHIYRTGLESAFTGGAQTKSYVNQWTGTNAILHDQQLIGHLMKQRLIKNHWKRFRASPEHLGYWMSANPLQPVKGFAERPPSIVFRREGAKEYFNNALVPFWHMQSSFSHLCSFYFICEKMLERHAGRLPHPKFHPGQDNVKTLLLQEFRDEIAAGRFVKRQRLRPMMERSGIYKAFFEGDLPFKLFKDDVWWEPGIFA